MSDTVPFTLRFGNTACLVCLMVAGCMVACLSAISACAAELKPETAAAFDRYIQVVEARMDGDVRRNQFLAADRLPDSRRREAYEEIRKGQIFTEQLHILDDGQPVYIPAGLIHHSVGVIFIPGPGCLKHSPYFRITITTRTSANRGSAGRN